MNQEGSAPIIPHWMYLEQEIEFGREDEWPTAMDNGVGYIQSSQVA